VEPETIGNISPNNTEGGQVRILYTLTLTIVTIVDKTFREQTRDKRYIYGRKMFSTVLILKRRYEGPAEDGSIKRKSCCQYYYILVRTIDS
jgi:hypothetical protein